MGLSHTASKKDSDFSRKSQIFRTPEYFVPPEGVPLGILYWRLETKSTLTGQPGREISLKISSAVWTP